MKLYLIYLLILCLFLGLGLWTVNKAYLRWAEDRKWDALAAYLENTGNGPGQGEFRK